MRNRAACFAAAFHNFVLPVIIVALGPTNFGIKGFFARSDAARREALCGLCRFNRRGGVPRRAELAYDPPACQTGAVLGMRVTVCV
ncbi:hypothetical protein AGR7A_Cc120258 [Agrobacterium deltaense NCPPB 1641]|uniref:Uncharacterized protein n=1 Tax=Agrobacterium deltaense NCPPB 1641 TaxID=1183425 RepID=A0A1S7TJE4_9HYPH|nr:hypothetical protein AGR7A_Cc120258 [Agrobacterium deltaense NCPPB 1641]